MRPSIDQRLARQGAHWMAPHLFGATATGNFNIRLADGTVQRFSDLQAVVNYLNRLDGDVEDFPAFDNPQNGEQAIVRLRELRTQPELLDFNAAYKALNVNGDRGRFHAFVQGVKLDAHPLDSRILDEWADLYDAFVKTEDARDLHDTERCAVP